MPIPAGPEISAIRGLFASIAFGTGVALLLLQRGSQAGDLGRRRLEQRGGLGQLRLERARRLGEQDLTAVEIGDPVDLVHGQRFAVHVAALDHKRVVVLREVAKRLGHIDGVTGDDVLVGSRHHLAGVDSDANCKADTMLRRELAVQFG